MAEYDVGGRRGLIIFPEGGDGLGWKILAKELGKVMAVFDSSPGKSHGGRSQLHLPSPRGKEVKVLSSSDGGGKVSLGFGCIGRPLFAKMVCMTELNSALETLGRCLGLLGKVPSVVEIPLGQVAEITMDHKEYTSGAVINR